MNTSEDSPRTRTSSMSPEARIGAGMTMFAIGVLFLLLGWAQWMREVHDASMILLGIGAVLFVVGGLTALMARPAKNR
jgi:uncharacterized membrane protein YhfC